MRMEVRRNDEIRITGYVNVVNRDSRPIPSPQGSFIEQVESGTFRNALSKNKNVRMCFNHGRTVCDQNSGLYLTEDNIGLYADATFTDREIAEKARNDELRGWSFGFFVIADRWEDGKRYLTDIDLEEVSILDCTPAYIATSVEVRDEKHAEFRSIEFDSVKIEEPAEDPDDDQQKDDQMKDEDETRAKMKARVFYWEQKRRMEDEEID